MSNSVSLSPTIPICDQILIIEHWRHKQNNTIANLSETFHYSKRKINHLINEYLKSKPSNGK